MMKFFGIVMFSVVLMAQVNSSSAADGQRPRGGFGGRPSYDMLLSAFDSDSSKDLAKEEVPGRVWYRLSQADADGDGIVTRKEFDSF